MSGNSGTKNNAIAHLKPFLPWITVSTGNDSKNFLSFAGVSSLSIFIVLPHASFSNDSYIETSMRLIPMVQSYSPLL